MAPDPATSKSRGSRHRSNEGQHNSRAGESMERGSQRSETAKGKGEKDGGGTESGRGVKRRQHGSGGDAVQGGTSGSGSSAHRSSKRWRGDTFETPDMPIPTDRWDGGASDSPKENAFSSGKSKQESDTRSGEGISGKGTNAQLSKDGGDVEKAVRKQKVTKASLVSDSRAITVMDLQETDISIIDTNIRIKNKVSYRREATLELAEPEVEKSVEENTKSTVEASKSRRRWDKDGHKGGREDTEDAHVRGNVGGEGSQERDRKKEKSGVRDRDGDGDRDAEARIQNGRRSGEGSRDVAAEVDSRLEVSDELDQSNDFKIQEELRNIELEKELENRIRRRREESGDRDRWRDDDREREGKRRSDSREERTRDERHRSRRDRERHSDRYESRQHREGSKLSEGRQRDDRYYESDREYRSHREDRYHGARFKDSEDQGRGDRSRDQDHRERKSRDNVSGYEAERRGRDKAQKEDPPEREQSYPTTGYMESSDGTRSEHRHKRARESDGEGYATEKDHSRHRGRPGESETMTGSDLVQDDRSRRNREDRDGGSELVHDDRSRRNREDRDAEGRFEHIRGSPRDNGNMRGKGRSNNWRNDGRASERDGEGLPSPRHDSRGSPSPNRMDYTSSPHLDDHRSPRYLSQRSPSSHIDVGSAPSRGKTGHGDWFESSNNVSTSTGSRGRSQGHGSFMGDRRDRSKWLNGAEEEVKGGIFRANRSTDEGREGSLSPHWLHDQHLPAAHGKPVLHGQDSFPRGVGSRGTMDARSDRGGWRAPSQSGSTAFEGGPLDHHGPDDLSPRDRNDRVRRISMNRPPGNPMVRPQGPQLSSIPGPSLAPLPPPPPFRPGIDNPAVLGPLSGGFDDASGSREQGRGDRKGGPLRRGDPGGGIGLGEGWRGVNMGNWNSRNQGPLPGTGFPPFPPQFGHPPAGGGGFPGMVQQFPGPPIFPGGGRPPMDMGFGGGRFLGPGSHMGDGGDGYLGPGRGSGWHGPGEVDDGRGPPHLGPSDGWEGPGPHGDDRHRHGRMEWERGGPMGVRGWERDRERDIWEGRGRDGAPDFLPHRSQLEPPPQSHAFPPAGSGWGMPRDNQVSNELKPRQERQLFDSQEAKRKPDRGPLQLKAMKPSGRVISASEGKLTKYKTATMQSMLAQLDISPDLAGAELYAQYRALLPASESQNQSTASEEEDSATSDPEDKDLNLEADPEAEALIAGPNLLAKLLPPLPDAVFEEALRLYRKPDTENRVQKSLRGTFVLPFDPTTIKVPSISLKLNRSHPVTTQGQPLAGVGGLLDQLDVDNLEADFGDELIKPNDEPLIVADNSEKGLGLVGEIEADELEDREGEAAQDEFMSLHREVAEYSDREFEAEMEDTLEDDSLKDVQGGEAFSERLKSIGEDMDSMDKLAVHKESIDPTDTLVEGKQFLMEADNNLQVTNVLNSEDPVAEREDEVENLDAESDPRKNVNSFVVAKGAVKYDNTAAPEISYVVEEEARVLLVETDELEVIHIPETLVGKFMEPESVQFQTQIIEEFSPEASMSKEVIEAAGEIFGEKLETDIATAVTSGQDLETELTTTVASGKDLETEVTTAGTMGENPETKLHTAVAIMETELPTAVTLGEDLETEPPTAVAIGEDLEAELPTAVTLGEDLETEPPTAVAIGEDLETELPTAVAIQEDLETELPSAVLIGEDLETELPTAVAIQEHLDRELPTAAATREDLETEVPTDVAIREDLEIEVPTAVAIREDLETEVPTEVAVREDLEIEVEIEVPTAVAIREDWETEHSPITVAIREDLETGVPTAVTVEEAVASVQIVEEMKDPEKVDVAEPMKVEGNGLDFNQDPSETVTVWGIQNHLPAEVSNAQLLENDARVETNGKLKEIVVSPPALEQMAVEEPQPQPLTRLRKRRASSRLLAQQSAEAQAVPQQEASDGLGVKKVGSRGTTRSSQRRSKRRGSTR